MQIRSIRYRPSWQCKVVVEELRSFRTLGDRVLEGPLVLLHVTHAQSAYG